MKKTIAILVTLIMTVALVSIVAAAPAQPFLPGTWSIDDLPQRIHPGLIAPDGEADEEEVEKPDMDGDLVADDIDNCIDSYNPSQSDTDNDGVGNTCDNCRFAPNADQLDSDDDGIGDLCVKDADQDGIMDDDDNCPTVSNPDQANEDYDFYGDACDIEAAPGTSTPEPTDGERFAADHNGGCSLVIEGSNAARGFGMSIMFLFGAIVVTLDRRRKHKINE
jgi:Thrombospondin type 3 repeat